MVQFETTTSELLNAIRKVRDDFCNDRALGPRSYRRMEISRTSKQASMVYHKHSQGIKKKIKKIFKKILLIRKHNSLLKSQRKDKTLNSQI